MTIKEVTIKFEELTEQQYRDVYAVGSGLGTEDQRAAERQATVLRQGIYEIAIAAGMDPSQAIMMSQLGDDMPTLISYLTAKLKEKFA